MAETQVYTIKRAIEDELGEVLVTWITKAPYHAVEGTSPANADLPADVIGTWITGTPVLTDGPTVNAGEELVSDVLMSVGPPPPANTITRSSSGTGEVSGDIRLYVPIVVHMDTVLRKAVTMVAEVDTLLRRKNVPVLRRADMMRKTCSPTVLQNVSSIATIDTSAGQTGEGEVIVRFQTPATWVYREQGQHPIVETSITIYCDIGAFSGALMDLCLSLGNERASYISIYAEQPATIEKKDVEGEELVWAYLGQIVVTPEMLNVQTGTIYVDLDSIVMNLTTYYTALKVAFDGVFGGITWQVQATSKASTVLLDTCRSKVRVAAAQIDTTRLLCNTRARLDTKFEKVTRVGQIGKINPKAYILDTQYTVTQIGTILDEHPMDDPGEDLYKMFDGDPATYWHSDGGIVSAYFFFSRSNLTILKSIQFGKHDTLAHMPIGVTVWGSKLADVLDVVPSLDAQYAPSFKLIGAVNFVNNQEGVIEIPNHNWYRSYRIFMYAANTAGMMAMSSITIMGMCYPKYADTKRLMVPHPITSNHDTLRKLVGSCRADTFRRTVEKAKAHEDTRRYTVKYTRAKQDTSRRCAVPFGYNPNKRKIKVMVVMDTRRELR